MPYYYKVLYQAHLLHIHIFIVIRNLHTMPHKHKLKKGDLESEYVMGQ